MKSLGTGDRKTQRSPAEQIGSVTHMARTPSLILIGYMGIFAIAHNKQIMSNYQLQFCIFIHIAKTH